MPEADWKKALWAYLRTARPLFIVYAAALLCFGTVAFLIQYPLAYFLYSVLLLTVFLLVYLVGQGARYIERYQTLQRLKGFQLPSEEDLGGGKLPLEDLYQEWLLELGDKNRVQAQAHFEEKREQLDYFTLWLHQVKTPIAAMSLLNQRLPSSYEKRQLEQELIRVEDYTNMALSYLKLEEHNQELDLTEVDLDAAIRKVIKKYSVLFIYNHIQLDYQPTHLKVISDGKWLEVMLEQIISNSLKYAPGGKVQIYADPKRKATLVVEDDGIGIRSEDLPKIFEKGYSGLNGRLHEKSTGLGLFLSRKICLRLGHRIHIDSRIHEYTKVSLKMEQETFALYD